MAKEIQHELTKEIHFRKDKGGHKVSLIRHTAFVTLEED